VTITVGICCAGDGDGLAFGAALPDCVVFADLLPPASGGVAEADGTAALDPESAQHAIGGKSSIDPAARRERKVARFIAHPRVRHPSASGSATKPGETKRPAVR
jgi:hypothetical protein